MKVRAWNLTKKMAHSLGNKNEMWSYRMGNLYFGDGTYEKKSWGGTVNDSKLNMNKHCDVA